MSEDKRLILSNTPSCVTMPNLVVYTSNGVDISRR